jgi:hypothetical protein
MQPIDAQHTVVDLVTLEDVEGAIGADLDAHLVLVQRTRPGGGEDTATLYYPCGLRIVRRR